MVATLCQETFSTQVSCSLVRVLAAVDLDHEFPFVAAKIHYEITDGELTAKLEAVELAGAKTRPQPPFSICLIAAESARAVMRANR